MSIGQTVVIAYSVRVGMGKSTLCDTIRSKLPQDQTTVCSADRFFIEPASGEYKFDHTRIKDAHEWCHSNFQQVAGCNYLVAITTVGGGQALRAQQRLVIVDNTCIKKWEYQKYVDEGTQAGYRVCKTRTHVEMCINLGAVGADLGAQTRHTKINQ